MTNFRTKFFLLLVLAVLISSGLACKLSNRSVQPTPIPVTTQAVNDLATQVAQAAATAASGGSVVLELTEEQLTSAAATELQKQGDMGVKNIQVLLRDGVMKITGSVSQSGFNLPLTIAIQIAANGQGGLQTQIVQASIGPVSLPSDMTSQVSEQLNQMLLTQVGADGNNYFIDSVGIGEGKLTIVAHKR
jgi:uncharacterized protein YpmS